MKTHRELSKMANEARAEGDLRLAQILLALAAARAGGEEDALFEILTAFMDVLRERVDEKLNQLGPYVEWLRNG